MHNEESVCDKLQESELFMDALLVYAVTRLIRSGYRDIGALIHDVYSKTVIGNHLKKDSGDTEVGRLYASKYKDTVEEALAALNSLDVKRVKTKYEAFAVLQYALVPIRPRAKIAEVLMDLINRKAEEGVPVFAEVGRVGYKADVLYCRDSCCVETVENIAAFIEKLDVTDQNNGNHIFFRGHAEASYEMVPTLFREERFKRNEANMYCELLNTCPEDFADLPTHIDRLTEMQHYGLPTRLLDITSNPLTALYFAVSSSPRRNGEVVMLSVPGKKLKYAQSRTIAMMASLPLMGYENQMTLYESSSQYDNAIQALMEEVNTERPGFVINDQMLQNMKDYYVVMPNRINRRVDRQEGAFIICGLMEEFYGNVRKPAPSPMRDLRVVDHSGRRVLMIIPAGRKPFILRELDRLGVNKASLFPEIDDVAGEIRHKVR